MNALRKALAHIAVAMAVLACPAFSLGQSGKPAALTLERLAAGIQGAFAVLLGSDNFRIDSEWVRSRALEPTEYGHPAANIKHSVGRRGVDWFAHRIDKAPLRKSDGPDDSRVVFRDGASAHLNNGALIIMAGLDGNAFARWEYTDGLSLNMYRHLPSYDEADLPLESLKPFLTDMVAAPDRLKLRPQQEQIDGHWCHVLEAPGVATYWVDTSAGFAVRRWQHNWKGHLLPQRQYENRNLRQVKPGLWLPTKQLETLYADPAFDDAKYWGKKINERDMVATVTFDQVTDADFAIDVKPGDFVADNIQFTRYRIAHPDQQPFEQAIEFGKRVGSRSAAWRTFLYLQGLVALLAAVYFVARRLRRT